MAQYRKKPVVIDAVQTKERIVISTLEGDIVANPGDWIITGVKDTDIDAIFEVMPMPKSTFMDEKELRAFLSLLMCSDPWPEGVDKTVLEQFANKESRRHGFSGWIEALHAAPAYPVL